MRRRLVFFLATLLWLGWAVRAALPQKEEPLGPNWLSLDGSVGAGSLLVMEESELCGIITERDVMNRVVASRRDPNTTLVKDVMTGSPETIDSGRFVVDVLGVMIKGGFRHLPVVRGPSVVGVVLHA